MTTIMWSPRPLRQTEAEIKLLNYSLSQMEKDRRFPTEEELEIMYERITKIKSRMEFLHKELMFFPKYQKIVEESSKNPQNP